MQSFSFIHCGDLHLDSPFKGLSAEDPQVARRLGSATFEAFDRLVDLCVRRRADFLLVAGDVFDAADRSVRAQLKFRDGLERLSRGGIRSFLVHGNHDPLEGWSESVQWPPGVTVFGTEEPTTAVVALDGADAIAVTGMSYLRSRETRNLARRYRASNPHLFQIALLHANCGGNPAHEAYAPTRLEELVASGFDYWALGHIHEKAILCRDPYVVYPGNTQGRSIRELGERGCFLVEVDGDRRLKIQFEPLDVVRWHSCEVSINGLTTIDQLDRLISGCIDEVREASGGRASICRIEVNGRGDLSKDLRKEGTLGDLLGRAREAGSEKPFVWVQELTSDCTPEIDLRRRSEIEDFLGRVLQLGLEIEDGVRKEDGEPTLTGPLKEVLDELFEHRRFSKFAEWPDREGLLQILREAELLCVDLLESPE